MSADADLMDRVAELEGFTSRLVLAGDDRDGWGAWHNLLETRLMQERKFSQEVVAIALAEMRDHIVDLCKTTIETMLSKNIRGTHDAKAKYAVGDVVAHDGASFIARRDDPGPCPGPGWQLMARQGQRGIAGPRGERGLPGKTITGWIVDRSCYRVTPRFDDGTLGSPLDLRALFEQNDTEPL
jgi:hypothetical protein